MRRAVPWLVASAGVLSCVVGAVLFARADPWRAAGGAGLVDVPRVPTDAYDSRLTLSFDDPGAVLWTGGRLVGAALVVAGALLLAGQGGWLLARRRSIVRRRVPSAVRWGLLGGALGGLSVLVGTVLASTTGGPVLPVVAYTGSYAPLACPSATGCPASAVSVVLDRSQLTGLGTAVSGALVLAAVAGWWRGSDSRADQR